MNQHYPREVENFTTPFLVSFGVLVFMGLIALWAWLGYLAALITGTVIGHILGRLPRRD